MLKNVKLMPRLLVPIATLVIIVLTLLLLVLMRQTTIIVENDAAMLSEEMAERYGQEVRLKLEEGLIAVRTLSDSFVALKDTGVADRQAYSQSLKKTLETYPNLLGLWSIWEPDALDGRDMDYMNTAGSDATGRFLDYWYRDGGVQLTACADFDVADGYYKRPLETGREVVMEPFLYKVGGKEIMMTSECVPVKINGRAVGVVGADIGLDQLQEMVAGIKPYGTGFGFVVAEDGSIVAHPDKEFVGKNVAELAPAGRDRELLKAIRSGKSFAGSVEDGEETFDFMYVPISLGRTGINWSFAVALPQSKVFAHERELLMTSSLLGIGSVILLILVIFFIARSVTRPMKAMADAAGRIAEGDYDSVPREDGFSGELLDLLRSIDRMVVSLVENIGLAETKAREAAEQTAAAEVAMQEADEARKQAETAKSEGMLAAANHLEGIVNQVTSAAEELSAQVEQSSRGSEVQRDRASEAATAMEQMNASVLEVAQNASSAAESADNAKDTAMGGGEIVGQVVDSITGVQTQSMRMKEGLDELGTHAEGIGQIMNVITDIADQTNLLALNAAIEAARAGDAGRGFAVVADEVRKLAEKTMQATKEVGDAINAIQTSTRQNIADMDKAGQAVVHSTDLANQAGESLQSIFSLVENTADQVRAIATASEEQSAASEQITRSTDEVNRIAGETSDAMNQSAMAVSDLARLSEELQGLIEELKRA